MKKNQNKLLNYLVTTTLLAGGFFQLIAPVIAEGTEGGEQISNTATATYEDPNNPNSTINATSNTVIVTVAEVAGITVKASGITDATTSATNTTVQVGDLLIANFVITNVGNDPTKFRIPNLATVTGPGTVSGTLPNNGTLNNLQYSIDGGQNWINITNSTVETASIAPGGTVLVRVPVTVQAGAQTNDTITVTLGNTPGNQQNILRTPDGGDVFTVDNANKAVAGEVDGSPVNGTREASDTQTIKVGTTAKTYTLATILKTRTDYSNSGTPNIDDDIVTYGLGIRVEQNDPTGQGITPAPLVGTAIPGLSGQRILVSDAIPQGTELAEAPTAPPGWLVVYSTNDPTAQDANQATWTTTQPALNTVRRIGFVNDPNIITSMAPGATENRFSIKIKTTGAPNTNGPDSFVINNIAQLFGQTPGTNAPVYDDSGDNVPSNYTDGAGVWTPPTGTDTNSDGIPDTLPPGNVDDGYVTDSTDLGNNGTDTGNNNTGTGAGGEVNSFPISEPVASAVLNGPQNVPGATGPSGQTNDDFTNKSAPVPANTTPGSQINPPGVGFTNTVQNNGTSVGDISLVPTLPPGMNSLDLPDGTKVTITYDNQSAVYTYNQSTGSFTGPTTPVTILGVQPGTSVNYGVEVDLPAATPLSTDTISQYSGDKEFGFPVPILATIDTAEAGTNNGTNITIDRVYTGFLRLIKESRILPGTGPAVVTGQDVFSTTPKTPSPGNIIEYRIRYKNISDPQAGNGNVILNADKVVITEDGVSGGNNWALDNDSDTKIDTSNVVGSAQDSGTANIQFFAGNPATATTADQTGTTANTDVTKYINTVTGIVPPGTERTFTFQRKMN
ncbi:beta strand repeat-containing protein [Calothrix sp. 336/3]|uniref:beta strand repeat-containing protein n=1 Tax=Calothrix sp. 336/3 TaxID=1337936 RepID=UPI0004E45C6C|nr:hypothetical protein [Calothrix sp. 336/3]AKG20365.1 hypothetical protein IJ00_02655 [Calothrix sp. 336/3]